MEGSDFVSLVKRFGVIGECLTKAEQQDVMRLSFAMEVFMRTQIATLVDAHPDEPIMLVYLHDGWGEC